MDIFALTDIGRERNENQDSIYQGAIGGFRMVLAVADGMGGHAGGSVASSEAIKSVSEALAGAMPEAGQLKQAVEQANAHILQMAGRMPEYYNMGTTLTLAAWAEDKVLIAHVGDSRAYLLRQGGLRQLTADHSYVQYLVEKGKMTAEEARLSPYRNMITNALGMEALRIDLLETSWERGDTLLLCTDGLSSYFSDAELQQYLASEGSAEEKAKALLQTALERGGSDNISVVLAIADAEEGRQDA